MSLMRNLLGAAAAVALVAAGAPNPADAALIQVGFLLDSSGSITASGWNTITTGLANAIGQFVGKPDSYELTVVSFSSGTQDVVTPTVITAGNLSALKTQIQNATFLGQNTNFAAGFNEITSLMSPTIGGAAASYINFSTDGQPNEPPPTPAQSGIDARNAALAAGIDNISIEGIGNAVDTNYLTQQICFPQPCTIAPAFNFPAQGFYIPIASTADYATAISQKIAVITQTPEPASLALLGSALVGFGVLRRRRKA